MTSKSFYNSKEHPYYGRLNGTRGNGAWCPKTNSDSSDYLQVDMGAAHLVCAVATQGSKANSHWTTSYNLQLSTDGSTWTSYKEKGNIKVSKPQKYARSRV